MTDANAQIVSMLQTLTERFDALQKDVDTLKEKDARRSASRSPTPEAEPSDGHTEQEGTGNTSHPTGGQRVYEAQKSRRKARHRRSSSRLRSRSRSHSPLRRAKGKGKRQHPDQGPSRSWGDRMSDTESERMDYNSPVVFSDSEAEDQPNTKLVEVSERTEKFLRDKCTRRVPNTERRAIRERYPLPKVVATKTPQLDPFIKQEVSAAVKSTDKQLAKAQTLLLDSLAPLTSLLEAHFKGEEVEQQQMAQAAKTAVELIGNANASISHLRREKVIGELNKALLPVIGDDDNFKEANPLLFGTEFAKKGKDMIDQVKALRSTLPKKVGRKPPFFRGGPPGTRGGFSQRYGRGGARQFPYNHNRERQFQPSKGHKNRTQTQ